MTRITKLPDGVAEGADYLSKWSTSRTSGRFRDDPEYKPRGKGKKGKGKRRKKKPVNKMSLVELTQAQTK